MAVEISVENVDNFKNEYKFYVNRFFAGTGFGICRKTAVFGVFSRKPPMQKMEEAVKKNAIFGAFSEG